MGVTLEIVPEKARDLVVAGAMLSILANPLLFHLLDRREARKEALRSTASSHREEGAPADPATSDEVIEEPSVRPAAPSEASAALPSGPPPAA
jgi:monovalent cation:H+ antiporter-2, CPA2 family